MDNNKIISTLNNLIETCKDGQEGFRTCAKNIQHPELKEFFISRALLCGRSADELQQLVLTYGGDPETSSSVSAAMHRRWIDIKTSLMTDNEEAVLDECERGEDVALENYRDALDEDLPLDVRSVVERQFEGLLENHDQVKMLRDQYQLQK